MALFKADVKPTSVNIGGRDYLLFVNSQKLFDKYTFMQIQSGQYFFTNCFEYINKVNLNSKYEVVYVSDFALYFYIHDLKKDTLTAYNYDAYLYAKNKFGLELPIKFVSESEIEQNDLVIDYTSELVDAVYFPSGLANMQGKTYTKLRQHRNSFENHSSNPVFVPYQNKDRSAIVRLYESWKANAKETGNTFIVDAKVFKDGLDNDYLEKFVLKDDNGLIGFISYFVVGEWCFVYSMKTLRTLRNANVYLVNRCWQNIMSTYPDVKYINLGGIDNVDWHDDFKIQLKPDIFLKYYTNVEVR